jgi:hypothetical protein
MAHRRSRATRRAPSRSASRAARPRATAGRAAPLPGVEARARDAEHTTQQGDRRANSTRSGKPSASSCANALPADTPTTCAATSPYASRTPTASATRSEPVYGARPGSWQKPSSHQSIDAAIPMTSSNSLVVVHLEPCRRAPGAVGMEPFMELSGPEPGPCHHERVALAAGRNLDHVWTFRAGDAAGARHTEAVALTANRMRSARAGRPRRAGKRSPRLRQEFAGGGSR